MANYIKQLKDSTETDNLYPITLSSAVYMSDLQSTLENEISISRPGIENPINLII